MNPSTTPTLVRSPYQFCQYDGPLHPCYQNVLSVEFTEMVHVQMPNLRPSDNTNVDSNKQSPNVNYRPKRFMVYFYNEYALAINRIIQKAQMPIRKRKLEETSDASPDTDKVLFAFHNIPSKCIFPLAASDWYDREDMSQFCLCIGDQCVLPGEYKDRYRKSSKRAYRFDCDEMDVRVAIYNGGTAEVSEHQIKFESENQSIDVRRVSKIESVLDKRYIKFKKKCRSRQFLSPVLQNEKQNRIEVTKETMPEANVVDLTGTSDVVVDQPTEKNTNNRSICNIYARGPKNRNRTTNLTSTKRGSPEMVYTLLVRDIALSYYFRIEKI
jgi:hypothetical protein